MLALLVAFAVLGVLFYRVLRAPSGSGGGGGGGGPSASARPTRAQRLAAEAFEFAAAAAAAPAGAPAPAPRRNALVLYATEYGFAKEVARRACARLREAARGALRVRLLNVLDYACADFTREEAVVLVASTTGDGVPPNEAADFRDALTGGRVRFGKGVVYGVLALGDKAYPHFCRGGEVLAALLEKEAGEGVVQMGKVDQEDMDVVDEWLGRFVDHVEGESAGSRKRVDQIQPAEVDAEEHDYLVAAVEKYSATLDERSVRYSRNEPCMATVAGKQFLTSGGRAESGEEAKCVIRVEFDIGTADFLYKAGDALGVVPVNNDELIEKMLQALAAVGDERVVVGGAGSSGIADAMAEPMSFRNALMEQLDLKTVRPELIAALGAASDDESERVWAGELVEAGPAGHFTEAGKKYAELRHVIDVLGDFPGAALTPPEMARLLRPLTARYYSISSSPVVERNMVAITVDVLRYRTLNTPREGVASTYLCDRIAVEDGESSRVGIFVSRNDSFRLPKDPSVPIIMIGPGTGIAPFVAFLDERVAEGAAGRNVLFFGCRHERDDFLYREKLEGLVHDGKLELETAFSRDQSKKIYVQDRMRGRAKELWKLIDGEGAHTYICGDGRRMAPDVEATLCEIFRKCGRKSANAAAAYRDALSGAGRLQRDVWVP